MKKIGIDMDGVVTDFISPYCDLLFEASGIRLPPQSEAWPFEWHFDKVPGISAKHRNMAWDKIRTTNWFATLLPLPGALEAIERLNIIQAIGHEVYFVTARSAPMAKKHTELWLSLAGMHHPTVLIAERKGDIAYGLQLDILVDDKLENIEDTLDKSPTTRAYLINRPYNQGPMVLRCASLGHVLDLEFPLCAI